MSTSNVYFREEIRNQNISSTLDEKSFLSRAVNDGPMDVQVGTDHHCLHIVKVDSLNLAKLQVR